MLKNIQNEILHQADKLTIKELPQLTVIAAFIITGPHGFQIVSIGTGTKCVPGHLLSPEVHRLKQNHAEVIAKRGLQLYIVRELTKLLDGEEPEVTHFEKTKENKFRLKDDRFLYFYTSQPPCGPCSIAPDSQIYGVSSARKMPNEILYFPPGSSKMQDVKQITPSLCCSDKIMLWNVLGVQGRILSQSLEPLYIDRIIVEARDPPIRSAIRHGISIKKRVKKFSENILRIKRRRISKYFKVNRPRLTFAIKHFYRNSKYHPKQDFNNRRVNEGADEQPYQAYSYSWVDKKVEKVNSLTGLKWGIAKKDEKKLIALCQISKPNINQKAMEISLQLFPDLKQDQVGIRYLILKQRIKKLIGQWPH